MKPPKNDQAIFPLCLLKVWALALSEFGNLADLYLFDWEDLYKNDFLLLK